jgi:hypothetical protein
VALSSSDWKALSTAAWMVAVDTQGSKICTFAPKSGVFEVGRDEGGEVGAVGPVGELGEVGEGGVLGAVGVLGDVGVLGAEGVPGAVAVGGATPADPGSEDPPHPTNARHTPPATIRHPRDTLLRLRMAHSNVPPRTPALSAKQHVPRQRQAALTARTRPPADAVFPDTALPKLTRVPGADTAFP